MVYFTVVKFASVFCVATGGALAFLIQPVLAKFLLPELGGGAGVWIFISILFQLGIFLGYLYALVLLRATRLVQTIVNTVFILLAAGGVLMAGRLAEEGALNWGFACAVAFSYILLSSTSPMVQAWLAADSNRDNLARVYLLFSFSNIAGIVALFSYPFLIETHLGLGSQLDFWILLFLLYSTFFLFLTIKNTGRAGNSEDRGVEGGKFNVLWVLIPMSTSAYLLSTTTAFSQNIPSSPFIWTVPLALYLLSYAVAFSGILVPILGFSCFLALVSQLFFLFTGRTDVGQFNLGNFYTHSAILFFICVMLHGALFRTRPGGKSLPLFYLGLAGGGLGGSIIAAVLLPQVFSNYEETWFFHFLGAVAAGWVIFSLNWKTRAIFAVVVAGLSFYFFGQLENNLSNREVVRSVRNFYGSYRVLDSTERDPRRILQHGGTTHGEQSVAIGQGGTPTTYYTREGGMGVGLCLLQLRNKPVSAICVGAGVGTAAAWMGAGDHLTFVEIDPDIIKVAEEDFSFIKDARTRGAQVDFIVGDGRKGLKTLPEKSADMLILDAFVGGGIPVHLLTKEAFLLYSNLLKNDGILAVHVSSRSLKLQGVAMAGAKRAGLNCFTLDSKGGRQGIGSSWVLCSRKTEIVRQMQELGEEGSTKERHLTLWTDDFSAIFPILKR